jgi:hypothetical protein
MSVAKVVKKVIQNGIIIGGDFLVKEKPLPPSEDSGNIILCMLQR